MTKEERNKNALISAVKIKAYADLINYDYWIGLKDFKGMSLLNNHSRKISQSAEQIQLILKQGGATPKSKEASNNISEYTAELWETLDIILMLPLEELKEFNRELKQVKKTA